MSLSGLATTMVVTSKMKERSGNLVENKAPLWKTQGRCRNVLENKLLIFLAPEYY
jgi:hypothetical protein